VRNEPGAGSGSRSVDDPALLTELELDRLMARLADGDRAAFDPLFRALHPRALRLARGRLAPDLADDAAQSALLRVFARASEFEAGRPALPWFYAVVANEVRGVARRRSATGDEAALAAIPADDDPEQELLERELRRALAAAIEALDASAAACIGSLLGDRPRPDIAPAAFRKRVSRVYAQLRLLLGGNDGR
jgi:RNA polymerase sigma-70 factor (ECF subfamily)